jgi:hypothetical protein
MVEFSYFSETDDLRRSSCSTLRVESFRVGRARFMTFRRIIPAGLFP